jgi:hypothetical protein
MSIDFSGAMKRAMLARAEFQRQLEELAAEQRKHDRRCGAFDGPPTTELPTQPGEMHARSE